jgi:hypothetical protein
MTPSQIEAVTYYHNVSEVGAAGKNLSQLLQL